ncbi:MAG TPA: NAD(P)/FAD-dependent oxidoreductase [Chitinophagales bacterium]|nr:NAD(P)/FAD-dependent oxidoreductase [Chitinophagales bacterium]
MNSNKYNLPPANGNRVVIIGGGFGGINLVDKLQKSGYQAVMLDRNNYHLFQPLLYQVATGGLEPGSIAFPLRKLLHGHDNMFFRVADVTSVDLEQKIVHTNDGHLSYDYLVIGTGSATNFFGNQELEKHALAMKRVTEALDLRSFVLENFEQAVESDDEAEKDALINFVIVGGGPTGVELAGALSEMRKYVLPDDYPELNAARMQITLMEAGDRLIAGMDSKSSEKVHKYLLQFGVNVMTKCRVNSYDGRTVVYNDTNKIEARTLIWAAGVAGNPVGSIPADVLTRDKRLLVDEFNRLKGYTNVFAIGDVAAMVSEELPRGHPMLAPVAVQQGKHLAKNLKRMKDGQPMLPFKYFDKGVMATVGRNKAVAEVRKFKMSGWLAWQAWLWVHLMFLIGIRNKVVVLFDWFWNYLTYDRATRLIIRPVKRKREASVNERASNAA